MHFILLLGALLLSCKAICQLPDLQVAASAGGFYPRPLRSPWASNGVASHPYGQPIGWVVTGEVGSYVEGEWYAGVQGWKQSFSWQYDFRPAVTEPLTLVGGGFVLGWLVGGGRHWDLFARLSPALVYCGGSATLADTAAWNSGERVRNEVPSSFRIYRLEQTHRADFFFVLEGSVDASWRLSRHHALTARLGYVQGFRPFITERVLLQSDKSALLTAEFTTRINGSGLRLEVGYAYGFNFPKKISTKYREIPPGGGFRRRKQRLYQQGQ